MIKLNIDMEDCIRRYRSGDTINAIAKHFGCDSSTISFRLQDAGIRERTVNRRGLIIDETEMINLYNSGKSVEALALHFGCDRGVINRRLLKNGIEHRNRSDAMFTRMSQTSEEERCRLTNAANNATRDVTPSLERMSKAARTREITCSKTSRTEYICADWLRLRGFDITLQKTCGIYNIDIAINEPSIAVEIFGGHWHVTDRHSRSYRKRIEYLLDCGYIPVIIWVTGRYPLESGAVDYIVSLAEKLRRGEPVRREEQMISGNGNLSAIGKRKSKKLS